MKMKKYKYYLDKLLIIIIKVKYIESITFNFK